MAAFPLAASFDRSLPRILRRVVTQTGFVPGNDLKAAFLGDIPPGQYTATISGKDGGTGVGLIEVFKLSGFVVRPSVVKARVPTRSSSPLL